MGPRERGAAARHSQIFIPEETPRSCCCGRAAGPCAVAALLAALALATMETPAEEDRAEPASPQTPPLNVPPRLDDLQRQLQSLETRIQSLEMSFADLVRILIGSTIERRAAQPYSQQLRNLLPGDDADEADPGPSAPKRRRQDPEPEG